MFLKKWIFLASLLLLAGGCASNPPSVSSVQLTAYETSLVHFQKSLLYASENASESREMMARVKNTLAKNKVSNSQVDHLSWQSAHRVNGLQKKISMDWVGDVDGFSRAIGKYLTGWKVRVLGLKPTTLPILSIFKKDVTVQEVLEGAGLQLGKQVDIIIQDKARVIQFVYLDEKYDN